MQLDNLLIREPQFLIKAIISCIESLVEESDSDRDYFKSVFDLRSNPTISIAAYIARLYKYMLCSPSCFIYALILIDKVQQENSGFKVTAKNVHRLMMIAILLSAKYLEDIYYKNSYYASVGGIKLQLLNHLEIELLRLLNFRCNIEPSTFQSYENRLLAYSCLHLDFESSPRKKLKTQDPELDDYSEKLSQNECKAKCMEFPDSLEKKRIQHIH